MKPKKAKQEETGSPVTLSEVKPGDVLKPRGPRPGFFTAPPTPVPKSSGWTVLRYRTSRAEAIIKMKALPTASIALPLSKAREMVNVLDEQKKWVKMSLQSIEDFEAILANPEWLVEDRIQRIEQIVGTMHARLSNFKRTLE